MNKYNNLPDVKGIYKFDEDLSKYNYFKTGGRASVMFFPYSIDDLVFFLKNFKEKNKIFIIGAGSNLLIRDEGFNGVVINLKNLNNIHIENNKIFCECGVMNAKLFNFAKNNNIANYELFGLIPGTVGGSCRMNAGCYGQSISDILEYIDTVDFNGNTRRYYKKDFELGYRYNSLPNDLIFINTCFNINNYATKKEILDIFNEKLIKKINTQPVNEKTCGSTFKNLPDYPAWKIVQELGFQGINFNGVKMSEKHANFLINVNGTSTDIENLINKIIKKAKKEKNIELDLEIKIL